MSPPEPPRTAGNLAARAKHLVVGIRRHRRRSAFASRRRTPSFLIEIKIGDGAELRERLLREGLDPSEVILKYFWPRYAPPSGSGIRALSKSESLAAQFERLIAMHREAPSRFPMPVATVKSNEGEFAGYVLEYVEGETLQTLISNGMLKEANRHVGIVEATVAKLHAKEMPHGDLNASNIIVADDGRTVLIDPVPNPGSGTKLQDEICIGHIKMQIQNRSVAP